MTKHGGLFPCKANKFPHLGNNVTMEHFYAQPIQHTLHTILLMLQVMNYTAHLAHQDRKIRCVHHQKLDNPHNMKISLTSESTSHKIHFWNQISLRCTHLLSHQTTTVPNFIASHLRWTASNPPQHGRWWAAGCSGSQRLLLALLRAQWEKLWSCWWDNFFPNASLPYFHKIFTSTTGILKGKKHSTTSLPLY